MFRTLSYSAEKGFLAKYGMGKPSCKHLWVIDIDEHKASNFNTKMICAICGKTEKNLPSCSPYLNVDSAAVQSRASYEYVVVNKPIVVPRVECCKHVWAYSQPRHSTIPKTRDRICALCWKEERVFDGQVEYGKARFDDVMLALIECFSD